jgi:hypothetical protein
LCEPWYQRTARANTPLRFFSCRGNVKDGNAIFTANRDRKLFAVSPKCRLVRFPLDQNADRQALGIGLVARLGLGVPITLPLRKICQTSISQE